VRELQEINRRTGLDRTLAIGELILTRFFAGSPDIWRERSRNKNNSIRRLAARPDCPLKRSALNDAVAVFVIVSALPSVRTFGHVGSSHVAATATLSPGRREQLLVVAEAQCWTVRRLKEEMVSLRRQHGETRGRRRSTEESRALANLHDAVVRLERSIQQIAALLLTPYGQREVQHLADQLRSSCAAIETLAAHARANHDERGDADADADGGGAQPPRRAAV
jgi:hypothetical protein